MIWGMSTALLIFNHGLPSGVLMSFVIMVVGLTIGWPMIWLHQYSFNKKAMLKTTQHIQEHGLKDQTVEEVMQIMKEEIIREQGLCAKLFS